MPRPDYVKDFLQCLDHFRYRHHIVEVFRDWAEIVACALHQKPYHDFCLDHERDWERVEADYMAVVKRYEAKDFDVFIKMWGLTAAALNEEKQDFLGECFMRAEVNRAAAGQFFTPYALSLVVARMAITQDIKEKFGEMGYIDLHEPTCGSGGMIIAAAQVIEEEAKCDPSATLWFQGIDIDRQCANMAYIQCSLLGLSGVVWHGDTLRMNMNSYRITPAARLHPTRSNRMMAREPLIAPKLPQTGLVQMPFAFTEAA